MHINKVTSQELPYRYKRSLVGVRYLSLLSN